MTAQLDDKPDQGMLEKKAGGYFPYVIFMDSSGDKLFEFRPSSEETTLDAVADAGLILDIRTALEKSPDDKLAGAKLTLIESFRDVRSASLEELAGAASTAGIPDSLLKRYDAYLAVKPIKDVLAELAEAAKKAQEKGDFQLMMQAQKDAGQKLYDLYKAGTTPTRGFSDAIQYWQAVMQFAMEAKDKETAFAAVDGLEGELDAKYKPQLDALRTQIENM